MFSNYYSLFVPQLIIQVLCIVHAIRNHKDRYWIYLIMVPYLGVIAYVFAEILPGLKSNGMVSQANEKVEHALFPKRRISELEHRIALADTYQNRINLAEAYAATKRYDEAIALFNKTIEGIYKDDPTALSKRALTYYMMGNLNAAKKDLEQILTKGNILEEKEQLIYATILESLQEYDAAIKAYSRAMGIATGLEAEYRYAILLQKLNREEEAYEIFRVMLMKAKSSPSYFRKKESKWLNLAKEELQQTA